LLCFDGICIFLLIPYTGNFTRSTQRASLRGGRNCYSNC